MTAFAPWSLRSAVDDHVTHDANHDAEVDAAGGVAWRVAIVGCGPRGMYCLERLAASIRSAPLRRPVEISIYDPTDHPGAGPVYSPASPAYLRMNFAARHVDARPVVEPSPAVSLCSLVDWLAVHAPQWADPDAYVPRATVGGYLNWCYRQIVATLPAGVALNWHRHRASALHRVGSRWEVVADGVANRFDEVVATVGHEGWRPISDASAHADWPGAGLPRRDRLFPIDQGLEDAIAPGATVVARGFALTWIDACLALSVGRGGTFEPAGDRLRYVPGGREPARILPWSRTGRPMLAKVDRRLVDLPRCLDELWEEQATSLRQIARKSESIDFADEIWPRVLSAADEALRKTGRRRRSVSAWYQHWLQGPHGATEIRQWMLNSYLAATGRRPLDEAWALGEAYRQLYPAIVDLVSHGGLATDAWPRFRQIAREMERIAFGPPAENVGRILALIDAGVVDLSLLDRRSPGRLPDWRRAPGDPSAAVALETRIPGCCDVQPGSVVAQLLAGGIVRRQPGAGGIAVNDAGRPLDRRWQTVSGLAILGRVTEGCILGNDTLSRRLHQHPDRWAEQVVQRFLREEIPVDGQRG